MKNLYPSLYALGYLTLSLLSTSVVACPPGYLELKSEHAGTGCVMGAPALRPAPPVRARKSITVTSNAVEKKVRVIDRAQETWDAQSLVRSIERISRQQHLRYR